MVHCFSSVDSGCAVYDDFVSPRLKGETKQRHLYIVDISTLLKNPSASLGRSCVHGLIRKPRDCSDSLICQGYLKLDFEGSTLAVRCVITGR